MTHQEYQAFCNFITGLTKSYTMSDDVTLYISTDGSTWKEIKCVVSNQLSVEGHVKVSHEMLRPINYDGREIIEAIQARRMAEKN